MKGTVSTIVAAAAITSAQFLSAGAAVAGGWPRSVAGTWGVVGNQTAGNLIIVQPASPAPCKPISGTIYGDALAGFYCPTSGRIVFHRTKANNTVYQYWQGNLSQSGTKTYIGGNFSYLPDPGEYSFYACKPGC